MTNNCSGRKTQHGFMRWGGYAASWCGKRAEVEKNEAREIDEPAQGPPHLFRGPLRIIRDGTKKRIALPKFSGVAVDEALQRSRDLRG